MHSEEQLGAQRLIAGIIAEAVSDFVILRERGVIIKDFKVSPQCHSNGRLNRRLFTYSHTIEVKELIEFFTEGHLEELIDLAAFDLNAEAVRRQLYK